MKKIINLSLLIFFTCVCGYAQPTIYPAPVNTGLIVLKNATIHVGNGTVIQNGNILINGSKIEKVGSNFDIPSNAVVYNVDGKHIYPGLISASTNLGLKEVTGSVRGTNDYDELGDFNPSIKSIVAYNTDSKVINVLRTNGILLANVIPQNEEGSSQLISGTSSVVQLDAWNWLDAVYQKDGQMHVNIPSLRPRRGRFGMPSGNTNPQQEALDKINSIITFFKNAKAYLQENNHAKTNLNYEATKGLFDKTQKLFVHSNGVKEMLIAIDFVKEFGFDVVIVGGEDSWRIAPLLKENNIPVILKQSHSLPLTYDDDIDQPFKTPFLLQKAGVLFAIGDNDETTRGRNLMFNAGTAAAYGLTKEEALSAITWNAARILGIDQQTGTIQEGKDANIIVSEGDILDMPTSIVSLAFIQGRKINLGNHQTQLSDRYLNKYGLK